MSLHPLYARSSRGRSLSAALIAAATTVLLPLGLLSGCQTPAAPVTAPAGSLWTAQQNEAFQSLGFVQEGDSWSLNLAASLLFDFDSEQLNARQLTHLQRIGEALSKVGIEGLRVEGHSDNVGVADYNLRLSQRRAAAVAQTLAGAGMKPGKLVARGFGRDKPIADNGTEAGRAQNRRVALIAPSY